VISSALLVVISVASAQDPVEYRIQRTSSTIKIDAKLDEPSWRSAPAVSPFIFNHFTSGEKEPTEAKMLWDDDNLYVSWRATDRHISAYEKQRHGPVSKDDCVEIFISPNPKKVTNYYTFEINAIGTMLNRNRTDWWKGPPTWEPEGVEYRTTFHGRPAKDEAESDREWIVEMAIPLRNFSRDAANTPPQNGDEWRLNLNRLGGKTNAQASTWSPLGPDIRSFHTPAKFGKVVFVTQGPQVAQAPARRGARGRSGEGGGRNNLAGAEEGRVLYNRSCTMCHGLDGAAGDRAPALGAQRRYLRRTEADLYDAIKNGIKGTLMPASPLPESDVRKMIAYIFSLRATAADLTVAGNVERGEQVFHGKGQCAQCHMIRGRGGLVGPDLTSIGSERRLDDLRAALTQAKPVPPLGFKPVNFTAKDGKKVRGVVKNENNFSLQILGTDNKLHLVLRSEVSDLRYEEKSLMPADLDKKLGAEEFQDLLAFLSRQAGRRAQ
jgi:cytochrome c oxidase cbb3-type subunit 3